MQTSQKLKTNNQYQENQADFALFLLSWSLPPEALTWYPAGGG
jgi:hypothetical protein